MIPGYRLSAWILIFLMFLQPFCGLLSYAEEEVGGTSSVQASNKAGSPRKRAPSRRKASSKKSGSPSQSIPPKGEKYLTRVIQPSERAILDPSSDDRKAVTDLASQDSPWTEELDILGPDEISPVLATSIFGGKGKRRINLIADDIEIKTLMDKLATDFRLNLVSKAISGRNKIKASLYDLPLETVFHVLLEQANLTYEKRNGIFYLQEQGKAQDAFLTERFFKLKEYADFKFARALIDNIAVTKGRKIIENAAKKTFFVVEYARNLDRIDKVLGELGYLEDLDPDGATFYYHYLSYSYVASGVVKDIIEKYKSKEAKYSPDEKSNRFIVFDTRISFEKMKQALTFVDVPRGQVFIDVLFVDLTESDKDRLGIDTVLDWNRGSPDNADQLVTTLATDVTNFFSFKQPSHLTNIKVSGIKENSKSNILNNPKLMVLNNEKAVIDVTEKFPFVTTENQSGVISSKIENVDIGVKLEVTPRINANREVELDVKPTITVLKELKTIITKVVDTNQANAKVTETSSEFPITDERSIDTKVIVPTGRTLVIGGLVKETDRKVADRIPGLARLPILGPLFRRKSNTDEQSQLYIFLTPTIVRNAPVSTTFTTDMGNERFKFFPKGSIGEERGRERGLIIEMAHSKSETQGSTSAKNSDLDKNKAAPALPSTSVTKNPDSIDFSKFIKKIAALKDRQRVARVRRGEDKVQKQKIEKGFEQLIDKLESDIQEEKTEIKKSEAKKKPKSSLASKTRGGEDQERASRIAKLLKVWEKEPVDQIMADEDREEIHRQPAKKQVSEVQKKQVQRIAPKLNKPSKLKPQKTRYVAPKPIVKRPFSQPSTLKTRQSLRKDPNSSQGEPAVDMPMMEEGISMEAISPLGTGAPSPRSRPVEGSFSFGDMNGASSKSGDDAKRQKEEKTKKLRKKASKKKKVSYLRKSFEIPLGKFNQKKPRLAGASGPKPARTQKKRTRRPTTWETDFLDRNIARVSFSETEEISDSFEATVKAPKKLITKLPQRPKIAKQIRSNLIGFPKPKTAKRSAKTQSKVRSNKKNKKKNVLARSKDPRTQAIFDRLFLKKQNPITPAKSQVKKQNQKIVRAKQPLRILPVSPTGKKLKKGLTAKIKKPDSRPRISARTPEPKARKNVKEREFESFLDGMFSPQTSGSKQVSTSSKTSKSTSPKKAFLQREQEFMTFLESL
jgi:hypothetical protein